MKEFKNFHFHAGYQQGLKDRQMDIDELKKELELEKEQNTLLAQKCSDYADEISKLKDALFRANFRRADQEYINDGKNSSHIHSGGKGGWSV